MTLNHMNVWQNLNSHWSFPCVEPYYVDLSVGHAYSFTVANTTDADITAGVIELWGADADPTNWCVAGTFEPLEPVAGCSAIVSGVAEDGPVTVTITPEMPIKARSLCMFAAPCPAQFFQIRGLPAGVQAWATVSSLKRTNFDHVSPWGFIPQPMNIGVESMTVQLPPGQQQGVIRQQQPQPQPAQQRNPRPQPQPAPAR